MVALSALWLPIVLSAVIVFFASYIIHTVLPWHRGDYPAVPREAELMAALRPLAIPPGDYMVPRCDSMQEMRSAEFLEKLRQGPVLMMTVMPNGPGNMGASLAQWFVYLLVVGLFCGYVAGRALPAGADYMAVFRMVSVVGFLAFAGALAQGSIWYRRNWGTTLRSIIDGLVFGLLMAGVFGWLWPR